MFFSKSGFTESVKERAVRENAGAAYNRRLVLESFSDPL